jgi:hypothetical protein
VDSDEEAAIGKTEQDAISIDSDGSEGELDSEVIGIINFEEEELANAHRTLMHEGIIDLTADF